MIAHRLEEHLHVAINYTKRFMQQTNEQNAVSPQQATYSKACKFNSQQTYHSEKGVQAFSRLFLSTVNHLQNPSF